MKKTLTIFAILALTISTLVGCGKANEKLDTNEPKENVTAAPTQNVEPTDISENIVEPAESTETPNKRSEENPENGEVDLTGYLADYPLVDNGQKVFIKLPEGFNFYPDAIEFRSKNEDGTINETAYSDYYATNSTQIVLFESEDHTQLIFDPHISYTINDEYSINWYLENKDTGYGNGEKFEITELYAENEVGIYEVKTISDFSNDVFYMVTYKNITINLFDIDESTLDKLVEFYKTTEDPFIFQ